MVAIVFRTTGAWGAGQGFNLTAVQVDTNFYNLKTAVETIETSLGTSGTVVSIASFEVIGSDLYIHMTDSSVQGPFALPSATLNPRGIWQPSTAYFVGDVVSFGSNAYIVTFDHTSASVFDPNANDGAGHNYYEVLVEISGGTLPTGGTARQVLGKNSSTDFDVAWLTGLLPLGGTVGQFLRKNSSTDGDASFATLPTLGGLTIKTVTSAAYTFIVGDEGQYIRFTAADALGITVPVNSLQPFALGAELTYVGVNFTPSFSLFTSGVVVNIPFGFTSSPFGRGAVMTLKKVGTNEWDLFGLLAPA